MHSPHWVLRLGLMLTILGASTAFADVTVLDHTALVHSSGSRFCPDDGQTYTDSEEITSDALENLDLESNVIFQTPCGTVFGGDVRLLVTFGTDRIDLSGYAAGSAYSEYEMRFRLEEPMLLRTQFFHSVAGQGDGGGHGSMAIEEADGTSIRSLSQVENPTIYEDLLPAGDFVLRMSASYFTSTGSGTTNFIGSLVFEGLVVPTDAGDLSELKASYRQ